MNAALLAVGTVAGFVVVSDGAQKPPIQYHDWALPASVSVPETPFGAGGGHDTFMLDRADDDAAPARRCRAGGAEQCEIVRLGGTGGEHDFVRIGAYECVPLTPLVSMVK